MTETRRRLFCLLVMAVIPVLTARTAGTDEAARRPNILFILVDDMGWADVGCNGSTFYETPNIDRLAAEGMRFTDAYAACPVCSPTRAGILTGRYPARLRLTDYLKGRRSPPDSPLLTAEYADQLALAEVTLPEALKQAPAGQGYASAHVGKWHLGGEPYYPERQGFDLNVAGTHHGTPASYYWPYERPAWKIPLSGGQAGEYLTDRLTSEAVRFMEANRDRPFFLYLPYYAVHTPIQPRPDKLAKYEAKLKEKPVAEGQQNNPHYAAMVESVDENVGRLMEALRRLRLDERTLIVFTSDNGGLSVREGAHTPATINTPLRAGKGYLYEGGIRVPLIVRWPGVVRTGGVCRTPVTSMDFFPTVCNAAGLDPAQVKTNGPLDGVSLIPVIKDPQARLKREALYWHYPHFSNQGGRPGAAVRVGDWKLVEFYEHGTLELYNLKEDLGETTDLAKKMPEKARELQAMLVRWRKEVDANMPRPNPNYKPPSN
jgi:arylsulfatase A